jgi:putative chitinase
MDVLAIQKKLKAAGYDPGTQDGDLGPKTFTAIVNYTVRKDLGALSVLLGRALAADLRKYDITTGARISHFLAQAAHETGGFKRFNEMGSGKDLNHDGFDDYLQKYDFRKDLGNTGVGFGPRFKGRGIFQLTGFFNYVTYGKRIGIDLAKTPEKAAEPDIAVLIACLFWTDKKMNPLADAGNIREITRRINGGANGLAERQEYFNRISGLLGA